jgi:LAGLIDADG DNA endonuclease family
LTDYQKEVIFGSMLGDLTAERTHFKGNTRLRFYMSLKNKKLIYHLYSIFKQYVKTEPKIYNRKLNNLTKGLHKDIGFSTLKYTYFNWVNEEFYVKLNNKNIKILPKNSYLRLTPVSLAYWIMDDGSFNKAKGYLVLCTDSFSKEEVLHLISILENKFNLSCALFELKTTKNRAYRIRINKSSLPYLIDLIKIYVIPSMNYKIGL